MCHAQVDIYVSHKPTARTATVSVATHARTKLYILHVASCISDVTCRLCMALYLKRPQLPSWSNLYCLHPAVGSKLPCVLKLQSSQLQVTDAALYSSLYTPSSIRAHLKFSVYGHKRKETDIHTYIHTQVRNAVTLVWSSLRLTPINSFASRTQLQRGLLSVSHTVHDRRFIAYLVVVFVN